MINLSESKILLTGGMGFVGKHVVDGLLKRGVKQENIIIPRKETDDLMDRSVCDRLVKDVDVIINLAGNVGGIGYNREFPGQLFYDNLMMGVNLIEAARVQNQVKKFVQIGTICSYPKFTPVPFKEDDLWNGYPEETNAPYGIAKKALLIMLQSYKQQYNFPGIFLLPVNMYGPGDNFNPNSSHVIPALIKKIHDAKVNNLPSIEVWGDGSATREFFYADDAAEAIILAAEKYEKSDPVNIGAGMEISIKELVQKLAKIMDYKGELVWDTSKPNGQPRRMLDTTRAKNEFGFTAKTSFDEGLKTTIDWYENEYLKNNN
jgi:GDP-L-fucose synthase